MNQTFKVLSLFSSAGIGELGIEAAGLSILVSNELLQNRCDLYRENYPNVDNICGDIWEKEEDIIDRWHQKADHHPALLLGFPGRGEFEVNFPASDTQNLSNHSLKQGKAPDLNDPGPWTLSAVCEGCFSQPSGGKGFRIPEQAGR